jgi:hypothetical protein
MVSGTTIPTEDSVISTSPARLTSLFQRVLIVYRTALLRDTLVRVLTDGGLSVVGTVLEAQLDGAILRSLDPDVVVFDEAEAESVRSAAQALVFSPTTPGVKKVIVVGRGYLMNIAYQTEVLQDASIDDLVVRARRAAGQQTSDCTGINSGRLSAEYGDGLSSSGRIEGGN